MLKNKYNRKYLNLHVKHRLQIWLMVRIGGIIILTAIISGLVLYGYARHETINSFYDAHIKIRRLSDLLIPVVLSGCAVSLISGTILAIFLPQKIAGPLYRIEKDFQAINGGNLTVRTKLRTKDTLHNFSKQLNSTINEIDQKIGEIQLLNSKVQSLAKKPSADLAPSLKQLDLALESLTSTYSTKQKKEKHLRRIPH